MIELRPPIQKFNASFCGRVFGYAAVCFKQSKGQELMKVPLHTCIRQVCPVHNARFRLRFPAQTEHFSHYLNTYSFGDSHFDKTSYGQFEYYAVF